MKKIFTATLVVLILLSVAGIIYVVRFEEAVPEKAKKKAVAVKPAAPKIDSVKKRTSPPVRLREVAIIIDDIGYDLNAAKALLKIDADLTFAILPFQRHSREAAEMIHQAGREVLVHLPMEPVSYPRERPGEGALFTDMSQEELVLQLRKNIDAVPHAVGVNNHMGSRFMMDDEKLSVIFKELRHKRLFFIDSRTSPGTRAHAIANDMGLRIAERKIFIDHHRDYHAIYNQLMHVAQSNDHAPKIIIGHPYPETVRALQAATQVMRGKGVSIVPASRIIKQQTSPRKNHHLTGAP